MVVDPVTYTIKKIMQEIPLEILELAFLRTDRWGTGTTLGGFDQRDVVPHIRLKIIEDILLDDIGLTGAKEMIVPINQTEIRAITDLTWSIDVPYSATGGRPITQFLGIYIMDRDVANSRTFPWLGTNQTVSGAASIMNSHNAIPMIMSDNGHVFPGNRIVIVDSQIVRESGMLRVKVASDMNLSHINPGAFPRLSELGILATKAYIYRVTRVPLNRGQIEAGYELSVIKEIIDEYRDAGESYRELLREKWHRIRQMNDRTAKRRVTRYQIAVQ